TGIAVAVEPANVAETGIAVALGLSAAIGAGVRLVKPSILAQADIRNRRKHRRKKILIIILPGVWL
ncbi:MAG: hypothetical protein ACOY0R_08805, partial [Chloroflexota bacterium]